MFRNTEDLWIMDHELIRINFKYFEVDFNNGTNIINEEVL